MNAKNRLKYALVLIGIALVSAPAHAGFFPDMNSALDKLLASGLSFFAAGMVVLMATCFIFTATLADMLIYIGLALGPFLLALSPLRIFSQLGTGWLRFMMVALVYKAVTAVMLKMMEGVFDHTGIMLAKAVGTAAASGEISFPRVGALLALLGITLIGVMASIRITSIADSLVSGMGGGGFGAPGVSRIRNPPTVKTGDGSGGGGTKGPSGGGQGLGYKAGAAVGKFFR